MIYKNPDGQWDRIDCDVGSWDRQQQAERRSLFDKGIFRVEKSNTSSNYHLLIGDWSVGCWRTSARARTIISAAVSTYQGLQREGMLK